MMRKLACVMGLMVCSNVGATETSPWDFAFELGAENDSNVVNDDAEQNSGTDSVNRQLKLTLGYKKKLANKSNWSANYTYFNKDYLSIDKFDSDLHMVSLKTSRKFDAVKLGIGALFVDSNLNSKDFVQLKQISPNLSYFFNKTNYFHSTLSFGQKDFSSNDDRSTDQTAVAANYYHLFNGLNNYITAGVKFKDENASEAEYSYDLFEFKLSYTYRSKFFEWPSRLNLSYRYQKRDYSDEINDDIDAFRLDKRNQLAAKYRINWPSKFYSEFEFVRNFNQSNLASADYDQNKVGFLVGYKLK